jgi:hypothetical protein
MEREQYGLFENDDDEFRRFVQEARARRRAERPAGSGYSFKWAGLAIGAVLALLCFTLLTALNLLPQ